MALPDERRFRLTPGRLVLLAVVVMVGGAIALSRLSPTSTPKVVSGACASLESDEYTRTSPLPAAHRNLEGKIVFSTHACRLLHFRSGQNSFSTGQSMAWIAYFAHPVDRVTLVAFEKHGHVWRKVSSQSGEVGPHATATGGMETIWSSYLFIGDGSILVQPGRFLLELTHGGRVLARGSVTVVASTT